MKNILYIIVLMLITLGCQKVFEPEIRDVEPFLVVEGRITTEWGWQYVFLNKSAGYTEYPYFEGVTDASPFVKQPLMIYTAHERAMIRARGIDVERLAESGIEEYLQEGRLLDVSYDPLNHQKMINPA